METGGPVEAEPELLEYDDADRNGQDYSSFWPRQSAQKRQNRPQNANIGQFGGWGSGIQWGNRAQNAKIGQFGAGNANANIVQGRGGWGGFGHGWPPARHWPGTGSGRDRGTANANIVQGPGGPRGRMMYNAADASGCRCYFKGKPCSGRGKRTRQ